MSEYVDLAEVRKAIQNVNAELGTSSITLQLVLEKVKSLRRVNASRPVDVTTVLAYEAGQRTGGVVLDERYWFMLLELIERELNQATSRGQLGTIVRLNTIKNTIRSETGLALSVSLTFGKEEECDDIDDDPDFD